MRPLSIVHSVYRFGERAIVIDTGGPTRDSLPTGTHRYEVGATVTETVGNRPDTSAFQQKNADRSRFEDRLTIRLDGGSNTGGDWLPRRPNDHDQWPVTLDEKLLAPSNQCRNRGLISLSPDDRVVGTAANP